MHDFSFTLLPQKVIFGAGAADQLPQALDSFGWRRVLLVTTGSARRSGRAARVEALLGQRLAATFDQTQPHVPAEQVEQALALARDRGVEAILGLGGGSAIGLAKAVSHALEAQTSLASPAPAPQPRVPVAAIPTTYAGSEMTPVYGVTRPEAGGSRKVTVADQRVAPRLVLYDPGLTLDLPPDLTASTGVNALAHCVEAVYSITRHPLSTAAAQAGAGLIVRALPRCVLHGDDLDARSEMLAGAHLAGLSLSSVAMGLHHGLCHVLGGSAGVPHGIANAIILPHAMRFNLDAATPHLAALAEAMGLRAEARDPAGLAAASVERVAALVAGLNLPRRLRDVGVPAADLPRLAQLALQSRAVLSNPRPVGVEDAEHVLRAAW